MASAAPLPASASDFALGVLAAASMKLLASVDDVMWLLPFVAGPHRLTNVLCSLQYLLTTLVVASVASGVAVGCGAAIASAVDERSS